MVQRFDDASKIHIFPNISKSEVTFIQKACGKSQSLSINRSFENIDKVFKNVVHEWSNIQKVLFIPVRIENTKLLLKLLELFACTLMLPATSIMIF